ncbi:2-oxoglutarate-iron(II)-dependent oxygenase [Selaginella moellendorffii]|uniref:2-oxoglutarate-iron(II)-dependent oxygenase n=1 Tax=Selaginella moellendorffii TaxID=88036 RepID=D8R587_SELML|nr:2-oxoglutarate-iron(II)-dependent oxygenase [Selaginella moellendorffii]
MAGIKAFVDSCNGTLDSVPDRYMMPNGAADVSRYAVLPIVDLASKSFERDLVDACAKYGMFYVSFQEVSFSCSTCLLNGCTSCSAQEPRHSHRGRDEVCSRVLQLAQRGQDAVLHRGDLHARPLLHQHDAFEGREARVARPPPDRDVGSEYARNIFKLGKRMLLVMSEGLGLRTNRLLEAFEDMVLLTRANFYPACPNPRQALGMEGHTDSGGLTFVLQDGVGGLQLKQGEDWYNVRPLEGMLVVNMGDQLEVLSNGRYKSILHRVMVNSKSSRLSVGAFLGPSLDAEISPIPELVSQESPAKYRSRTYRDYMHEVYTEHFSGKNVYVA